MDRAQRVATARELRAQERKLFPVQAGGALPRGPAAAVMAARAHQQRAFGASLFGGRRLAPDTGPVKALARRLPVSKPAPLSAARAARLQRVGAHGPDEQAKLGALRSKLAGEHRVRRGQERLQAVKAARLERAGAASPMDQKKLAMARARKAAELRKARTPEGRAKAARANRLERAGALTAKDRGLVAARRARKAAELRRDRKAGAGSILASKPAQAQATSAQAPAPMPAPRPRPEAVVKQAREKLNLRGRTADRVKELRDQQLEHAHPDLYGRPDRAYELDTKKIHFDPDRFQYKLAAQGKHGVTDALSDVKEWNPKLAGIVSVWRDPANGQTYVVNGHHRMDLARKLNVPRIKVQYLDAKDAVEARGYGAMVNIAEGRGTSIDAAKFFRDRKITPEMARAEGVSLKENTARQGLALANLHPQIFKKVIDQKMSPERGAIIGGSGLSQVHQSALFQMLRKPKFKQVSNGTLKNLIDIHKASTTKTVKTKDLFGESEEEQSLALHRAMLEDKIKRRLSADDRLFGLVSKSKAAESLAERGNSQIDLETTGKESEEARGILRLFDQHKHLAGDLNRGLNEGAERLHAGEGAKKVESEHYKKAVEHLKGILGDLSKAFGS